MTGKEIRRQRMALNLTQDELGEKFGVSGNTIARWEREELKPTGIGMMQLAFRALEIESAFQKPELVEKLDNIKKQNADAVERIRVKHSK